MPEAEISCFVLSDFNASTLVGYLNNDDSFTADRFVVAAHSAPFGPVENYLLDADSPMWEKRYDSLVLWTSASTVSRTYARACQYETINYHDIYEEVDAFCSLVALACKKASYVIIPVWAKPYYRRGFGGRDRMPGGLSDLIARMNIRLADNLSENKQVFLLDTESCLFRSGKHSFNPKMWYLGKIPFSPDVFSSVAAEVKNILYAAKGCTRKLLVLDLDNTLWGGIVGDDGVQNLRLGGHDPIGEAFTDFQVNIKAMTNKGIVLAIVSKNSESVALEAINTHPEMVLSVDDFAGWRINWKDKAQNIVDLVNELNLGLQSVVFIDDNPVERSRVAEALPEVYVPEWPADVMLYSKALLSLGCFDVVSLSGEDALRSKMYSAERKRASLRKDLGSLDSWLSSLEIEMIWEDYKEENSTRLLQLINKTNQFNLSTRRLTAEEFSSWLEVPENFIFSLRVKDKYGDSGLVGILSVSKSGETLRVVDLILSCRVFGRKIEYILLQKALKLMFELNCKNLVVEYFPTNKNQPTLQFLEDASHGCKGPLYTFDCDSDFPDLNYDYKIQESALL